MKKLKLHIKIRPKVWLMVLLLVLMLYESYLLYYKVYANLSVETVEDPLADKKIVRLNFDNYKKTLDFLDGLKNYTPPTTTVANPFK